MAHKLTTCTFCGVGCGIYLETAEGRISGAYPSMSHPANKGRICVRGWNVHEVASSPDRLKYPLLRETKNQPFREVSWDEAYQFIAGRLLDIVKKFGPDSLAFFNSPRCSNEETYLLQKLARAIFKTNNVDHGAGVYCNNSIHVLSDMLGMPASTNSISELEISEVILVDGVDLCMQLPTIGGRVIRSKIAGAKLIVVDHRRHRVAEHADFFLQVRPGTEIFIYGAIAKVIVDRGLQDAQFIQDCCEGYEAFQNRVSQFDLLNAAEICGVPPELIEGAALAIAHAKSTAVLYSTGLENRSKDSIRALIDLVLLTGNLGKPGAGVYALTEHNNLQGVCDMGMLPDRWPGYQSITDGAFRSQLESVWQTTVPLTPGIGARAGLGIQKQLNLHAVWLCRYDPVTTAFFGEAAEALSRLDLVIVQHLFMTGTAQYAHVILPVAAFGEEQITYTNTERRIQLTAKIIEPPAGTKPAWQQITELAHRLGADWHYSSSSNIMEEIGRVAPIYSGAQYSNLEREYGRQWPCTHDRPLGTQFLFEPGQKNRRFRYATYALPPRPTEGSEGYSFALVFGHSLYYWHQNVLVKHSETLKREMRVLLLDYPTGFVEINTEDARRLGIRDGGRIRLTSPHGSAETVARVTAEVRQGAINVPFFVREVERKLMSQADENTGYSSKPAYVRLEKI